MKDKLEKLWENYFPFEHQKCSDECVHKDMEIQNREEFVNEILDIVRKIIPEEELYDLSESRGHDYDEGWNNCIQQCFININEK